MKMPALDERLRNPKVIAALNAVILIVLLVLLLFFARDITGSLLQPKKAPAKTAQDRPTAAKRELRDYEAILKNNPFGIQGSELTALSSRSSGAKSPSEMLLIGTISGIKEGSYAIFLDRGGQQSIFKTGQQVPGLGKLSRVDSEKAYILMEGREIEIPFSGVTEVRELKPSGAPSPQGIGRRTGESAYLIDQQKVVQALERPEQIMTDARFTPHMVDGKQQGFVLREVKPQGIYASLGLQNGDVLLRINEFTISSAENALQALTALRGIDRAQLDIIRGGSNMTLTYQIR